jgi:integrase
MATKQMRGLYRENGDGDGIFYAGVVIPKDIRPLFLKPDGTPRTWLQRSTGTRDPDRAFTIGMPWVLEFKRKIAEARRRTRPMTSEQAAEVVEQFIASEQSAFQRWMATSSLGPEFVLAAERFRTRSLAKRNDNIRPANRTFVEDGITYEEIGGGDPASRFLTDAMASLGIGPESPSYTEVREAIRKARLDLAASNLAGAARPSLALVAAYNEKPITFDDLLARWRGRNKKKPLKTYNNYKLGLRRLQEYVGHHDARRITKSTINNWVDDSLTAGSSISNIQTNLTGIRACYGLYEDEFPINPASRIKLKSDDTPGEGALGYTEEEARAILLDARLQRDPVRRWTPWFCAFTGFRLSEFVGGMAAEIEEIEGIWCFKIDLDKRPLAERTKNDISIRTMPLHPDLIAEGFLDYIRSLPEGSAIFPYLPLSKAFGTRGDAASKRIGNWIRGRLKGSKLKFIDPRKKPNHAWRHRFTTLLTGKIQDSVRKKLEGHSAGNVSDDVYGKGVIPVLYEAVCKLPNPVAYSCTV